MYHHPAEFPALCSSYCLMRAEAPCESKGPNHESRCNLCHGVLLQKSPRKPQDFWVFFICSLNEQLLTDPQILQQRSLKNCRWSAHVFVRCYWAIFWSSNVSIFKLLFRFPWIRTLLNDHLTRLSGWWHFGERPMGNFSDRHFGWCNENLSLVSMKFANEKQVESCQLRVSLCHCFSSGVPWPSLPTFTCHPRGHFQCWLEDHDMWRFQAFVNHLHHFFFLFGISLDSSPILRTDSPFFDPVSPVPSGRVRFPMCGRHGQYVFPTCRRCSRCRLLAVQVQRPRWARGGWLRGRPRQAGGSRPHCQGETSVATAERTRGEWKSTHFSGSSSCTFSRCWRCCTPKYGFHWEFLCKDRGDFSAIWYQWFGHEGKSLVWLRLQHPVFTPETLYQVEVGGNYGTCAIHGTAVSHQQST